MTSLHERIVWIMGSPRSGSTWLLRLLAHPWVLEGSATGLARGIVPRRGPDIVPVNESYLPVHLAPLAQTVPAPVRINDTRAGDPSYFFSDRWKQAWQPAMRRLVLERLGEQAALAAERYRLQEPLVVVKEPNGSHAADLVAELLPRSRMLFLQRDGRDVIDSMLDADGPAGWRMQANNTVPVESAEARLSYVREQAGLWLARTRSVERGCELLGPGRSLVVRYEDLLADPGPELERIDDWLGIHRDDDARWAAIRAQRFGSLRNRFRGRRKGVRAASPGLWRQNLTAAEQTAVDEIIGDKLAALGYER